MDGIIFHQNTSSDACLCIINFLSDEIKDAIRSDLSKICHGERRSISGHSIYSYKFTISEFMKRYHKKNKSIKVGMLGELLCHVLLFRLQNKMKAVSPYFNSEEGSIKKGFDIILVSKDDQSVWFAEVKAGEIGKSDAKSKIRTLIDLAKNDLISRIEEDNSTTWYSAINNIETVLESGAKERVVLIRLLSEFIDHPTIRPDVQPQQNAVLAPILFEPIKNSLIHSDIIEKFSTIHSEGKFKKFIVFAIQKSTITEIENFLTTEAKAT